jgi:hypothetical protein
MGKRGRKTHGYRSRFKSRYVLRVQKDILLRAEYPMPLECDNAVCNGPVHSYIFRDLTIDFISLISYKPFKSGVPYKSDLESKKKIDLYF